MPSAEVIKLALRIYSNGEKTIIRNILDEPKAVALDHLFGAGLLDEIESGEYEGNEALTMYVEALASVPFPVQQWVIPPFRYPPAYEES